MSKRLEPGVRIPDFRLPDENGKVHRLSTLQGGEPMVLLLGRGEHCPRERMHQREMVRFHEWCDNAFTRLVTILPNDGHDTLKLRISSGAHWPFLADQKLEVRTHFGIDEYTDDHHDNAVVPHALVVAPGLVIDRVYCGYWFWGRPSIYQLWDDLQDLHRRIKQDFDPTVPEVRAAWKAARRGANGGRRTANRGRGTATKGRRTANGGRRTVARPGRGAAG